MDYLSIICQALFNLYANYLAPMDSLSMIFGYPFSGVNTTQMSASLWIEKRIPPCCLGVYGSKKCESLFDRSLRIKIKDFLLRERGMYYAKN